MSDPRALDPFALMRLGQRLEAEGRDAPARVAWERAHAALEAVDPLRAAFARVRQVHAELTLRDLASARAHLAQALGGLPAPEPAATPAQGSPDRDRADMARLLLEPGPLGASSRRWLEGLAWQERGYLASLEERHGEAFDAFARALGAFEAIGGCREEGDARRLLALSRVYAGDHDLAALEFARAIACYERAGDASSVATTRGSTSYLLSQQGRHQAALEVLDESLVALRARELPTHWPEYQRALNLEKLDRPDDAWLAMRGAFDALQQTARRVTAPGLRARWLGDKGKIADHLLNRTFERGDDAVFHDVLQRLKSGLLADDVLEETGPTDATTLAEYRRVRARLSELDTRLGAAPDEAGRAERRSVLARLESLEATLDTHDAALIGARAASLSAVQASLPEGAVLLDVALLKVGLRAVLVTSLGRELVVLGDPRWKRFEAEARLREHLDRLEALTREARDALRAGEVERADRLYDSLGVLEELHDVLLGAPRVEAALATASELIVIPHRDTFGVPWHLLRSGGRFLVERLPVSVLPSAALLAARGRVAAAAGEPAATPHARPVDARAITRQSRILFLVTGHDPRSHRLALAETEQAMRCFRNVVLLSGGEATRRRLETEAGAFDIVHFAGHAAFDDEFPLLSHLALGAGTDDPSWERLTVRDVLQLRLRGSLVILSGCETARASTGTSDHPFGLAHAFLAAGARAVIGTHWPFEPDASRAVLPALYDALLHGATPQAALRTGQLAALARGGPAGCAYAWGAFGCTFAGPPGDARSSVRGVDGPRGA